MIKRQWLVRGVRGSSADSGASESWDSPDSPYMAGAAQRTESSAPIFFNLLQNDPRDQGRGLERAHANLQHEIYPTPHAARRTQAAMQAGLDVFAIDSPEHKELKDVERDLNLMEQVILGSRLPE